MRRFLLGILTLAFFPVVATTEDGNRLRYLDESAPYYVHRQFPKLVTPQWIGDSQTEAVVILAIDDMREHQRYEAFLRPILNRLKKIDGRAPISIMTNRIDPKEAHLQSWLREGVSLEVHTYDHPCPFFKSGKFEVSKDTYDKCVDLMASIPNSKPVAFRMPCCDSLNTPSPRHWMEIFNKRTKSGNFLTIDSSVFVYFTGNDPEIPRNLTFTSDGSERFQRYLPKDRTFVNLIEDYPYPYVVGQLCWQFPCMVPSDWEAQHFHKPNNPETVADWKAALDATVIKQGVMTMVFHPHNWIKADQMVELIDYANEKFGKKVKFLTFNEAQECMDRHLLSGNPIRRPKTGEDNGVRLLDVNGDGYLDVVIGNKQKQITRIWHNKSKKWQETKTPFHCEHARFGIVDGKTVALISTRQGPKTWRFGNDEWISEPPLSRGLTESFSNAFRFLDLDGNGSCELLTNGGASVCRYDSRNKQWHAINGISIPEEYRFSPDSEGAIRFVDINADGQLDVIFSDERKYGIYFMDGLEKGWSNRVVAGKRNDSDALPMIQKNGKNNGFFVHSRSFWWSNESTPLLKDHVARLAFNDITKRVQPAAKSAKASLGSIQVPAGLRVELVASEPLVMDPVAFDWGPDGKLWVVEMGDYPNGIDADGKHGGNVKFLEDTDGDGQYDKVTTFLANLGFPTGVMSWRKGVLVSCAPDIFYAEDTNGDGVADKKEILFTGFVEGNQQHRVNGFTWGLDNWLYLANGDSGGNVKSIKTGRTINISGRDLRIKPDTGEMEAVSGQSQFGRARDDWGNWFGNNNSHPMYHFVLDDHYLRRNPHFAPPSTKHEISVAPGNAPIFPISPTQPRFNDFHTLNRFTSANSAIFYRDNLLGSGFDKSRFVSEPVHNLVQREMVTADGVTFRSQRTETERDREFLASSDNWFRPTKLQTGPDGALYIADMYRHVIEHPKWIPSLWQKKLDLRAGHDRGRIYRVVPVHKKLRHVPNFSKMSPIQLVRNLESPNGWQRDLCHRLLVQNQDQTVVPTLRAILRESENPVARLHALCVLDGLNAIDEADLLVGFKDGHPGVRRHALRISEPVLARSQRLTGYLPNLVKDSNPQVQMQLAYSLGEWPTKISAVLLADLANQHRNETHLLAAVMSSVNKENLEPVLSRLVQTGSGEKQTQHLVHALLKIAQRQGNERILEGMLSRLLMERSNNLEVRMTNMANFLDLLADDQALADLKKVHLSATERQAILHLYEAARSNAMNTKTKTEKRTIAISLLGRGLNQISEDVGLLGKLLSPQQPIEVQKASLAALSKIKDPQVAQLMVERWRQMSPVSRVDCMDILLSRLEFTQIALRSIENKQIRPQEIDAIRKQKLLQHPNNDVRLRSARIFANSISKDREAVLTRYAKSLDQNGDTARGKAVFTKNCAACHKLDGVGQHVGPDLVTLAGKSAQTLLTAILDPNQAVEAKYLGYTAVLTNGKTLSGLLAEETTTSITIVSADGKRHDILRSDVDELLGSSQSAMPVGLEEQITPAQMNDLLAFLRAAMPKAKAKTFSGNSPREIIVNAGEKFTLPATNASIFGPKAIFEMQFQNVGFWGDVKDEVLWRLTTNKNQRYRISLDLACHENTAGNTVIVECAGKVLRSIVPSTKTWEDYTRHEIGELNLPAGSHEIRIRADASLRGYLMDLRGVEFHPIKKK